MIVPETEIIVTKEGTEILRQTVHPGDYVIGRDPGCEVHLDVELVSRRHAQLTVNYDHLLIEDLGSSNGTFVNGQPVTEPTRLWPNQKIKVGAATIELRRLKTTPSPDISLAPQTAAVRRMLPEEFLREKKYDIGKVVAQGGMGAILDAKEVTIERRVAMKVMLDGSSPDDLHRFVAEAKITGQLEHPSIVPIYELGVDENDQVFYTMKFVRGITLRKVLELMADGVESTLRKYPLAALLTIFQKVCDAVAFAHSKGVLHRDLKPENLMLGDFGEVMVMDWGLAKVLDDRALVNVTAGSVAGPDAVQRSFIRTLPTEAASATLSGSILGTPKYMSPEQGRGEVETLDVRSDIYALGAILYHLLALRPSVTGDDAMTIVEKVAKGEIEPLTAPKPGKSSHLPGGRIPDSLAAVVRKAMAFDKAARYACIEDLQRDLVAYQSGFATSAENAGLGRQLLLAIKRHKIPAAGVAAVLLVGATLGSKALVEGQRATREAVRANAALAELKKSAPALLQLAESEADSQRFDSARQKIDAALVLDPALTPAYWQRAWVLLGMERWHDAADALRLAQQHDPAGATSATLLQNVEKMGAASDAERWKSGAARAVFGYLQAVEATGPVLAFGGKLKLHAEERRKLIEQRLLATLGKGNFKAAIGSDGLVIVTLTEGPIRSLEPLRGLPVDRLEAARTLITDLEPLRGMPLQSIGLYGTKVTDLSPLHGMPLRWIQMSTTPVHDLSPLKGMPLRSVLVGNSGVTDLSPLAGMLLTELDFHANAVSRIDALRGMPLSRLSADLNPGLGDCSPLKGVPLEYLNLAGTKVIDLSFLKGMPLRTLNLSGTPVANIAALAGLPLEDLSLDRAPITDLSALRGGLLKGLKLRGCKKLTVFTPILSLTHLEALQCDALPKELLPLRESKSLQTIGADVFPGEGFQGSRPVAEFWAAYDARQATGKK